MIAPMLKYAFLVYHADYARFLKQLHNLGVVHIETLSNQFSAQAEQIVRQLQKVHEALDILLKKAPPQITGTTGETPFSGGAQLLQLFENLTARENDLKKQKKDVSAQIALLEPWGKIPAQLIQLLQNRGVFFHFYNCTLQEFNPLWQQQYTIEAINHLNGKVYFLLISEQDLPPALHGAELIHLPLISIELLRHMQEEIAIGFNELNEAFNNLAAHGSLLYQYAETLENELQHEIALHNTQPEVSGKMMLLQVWAPKKNREELLNFLNKTETIWVEQKPGKNDNVPILLENDRFSSLFHPVVNLFSLPAYTEIDLTPFFAPFFMLFFGMCLGDVVYGLIIFTAVTLLKRKKQYAHLRSMFTLAQFLGTSAIVFGLITGTVAGIDLSKANIGLLKDVKGYFISMNSLFNVSLIIGLIQIVFGMALRVVNNLKQNGWQYGMSPLGWIFGIAGGLLYQFTQFTVPAYTLIGIGLFCILIFSNPQAGFIKRIGLGLWDLYGITGLFGDVLSYVRLFALGLSSATLGFVVNTIALSALSLPPILGELAFLVILLLGHGLNFGISTLSSFVHPIRLTFVEFYKNAGFTGGGQEYRAFRIKNNHNSIF